MGQTALRISTRISISLLLAGLLHGQALFFSSNNRPANAPVDSNSGGGCTGSSGAWTCTSAPTITLADASADLMRYTSDGSTPTFLAGTLYSAPFAGPGTTFTLKAIACAVDGTCNPVLLTSVYTISAGTTVTFVNKCSGSSGQCNFTGTPSAGNAVAVVLWAPSAGTISTVCDGTGTGGCTGTSTYSLAQAGGYNNTGGGFRSWLYYTCNYAGTGTAVQIIGTGLSSGYIAGIYASGNTTTGTNCNDGYNHNQSTVASTAFTTSPNTVTTTNSHDLAVGLASNDSGGAALTAGNDGQGNTYTFRAQDGAGVVDVETLSETATAAYIATGTGPSSRWNMEFFAIK